jgi:hypothetical protein
MIDSNVGDKKGLVRNDFTEASTNLRSTQNIGKLAAKSQRTSTTGVANEITSSILARNIKTSH